MPARRRNLQRPLDVLLPLHVAEVVLVVVQTAPELVLDVHGGGRDGDAAVEEVNDLLDVLHPQDVEPLHDGRLAGVLFGQYECLHPVLAGLQRDGQRPADGLQGAI